MATYTPNNNLKKPAGSDYVLVGDFNTNADVIDAALGDLSQLQTSIKTSLVLAINEANASNSFPPYIGENLHWYVWNAGLAQYEDSGVKAEGEKGDVGNPGTGNNWYVGTAISGTSLTPSVYATGIPNAQIGDMYLNNGELPDTGRTYVCTLGGNAATALWKYSCLLRGAAGNGTGDMLTSIYDQDSDGIVNDSEKLGGNPSTWYQQATDGLSAEAAIVDEDAFPFYEASTSSHRKATWANIKAVLKTYFDALYTTALLKLTGYSKAASASAIATTDSINVALGKLEKGLDDKAVPATDFLATLATASWVGASTPYTQTVEGLTGVTSTSKLDVGLADTATDAQYAEAVAAQIRATGSDTGTVTFKAHGAKPTLALPIIIRMVN